MEAKPMPAKQSKRLHLLTAKEVEDEINQGTTMYALVARETNEEVGEPIPKEVHPLLKTFSDVFPEDLPNQLPPLRDIQHAIDLMNSCNEDSSKRALARVLFDEDIVSIFDAGDRCAVPALLTSKKDDSWRMCVNSHAINKITVKYRFPIPRLDDMLDMMTGATLFSKIDLKSGYYHIRIRLGDESGKLSSKRKMDFMNGLTIVASITDCFKQGEFHWTIPATKAFEKIKKRMMEAPVMRLHDFSKVFEVTCDSSGIGIGGVLYQEGHPVAYFSEKYINSQKKLNARHGRWVEFLQEYSYTVRHKAEAENKAADALSLRIMVTREMRTEVVGFERIKEGYKDWPDCKEAYLSLTIGNE
ncbi:uncharacterized protein LOC110091938 [Dendrobium catenatum]|uniref:uncharacterized protein LOC110091938 n=1 Tax=Dendrobium catenatum TaxID=906689 RepID=UPI0009F5AD94|nr:uncharacterized protein LOC110091938 [Dendrobium catenatum]